MKRGGTGPPDGCRIDSNKATRYSIHRYASVWLVIALEDPEALLTLTAQGQRDVSMVPRRSYIHSLIAHALGPGLICLQGRVRDKYS